MQKTDMNKMMKSMKDSICEFDRTMDEMEQNGELSGCMVIFYQYLVREMKTYLSPALIDKMMIEAAADLFDSQDRSKAEATVKRLQETYDFDMYLVMRRAEEKSQIPY